MVLGSAAPPLARPWCTDWYNPHSNRRIQGIGRRTHRSPRLRVARAAYSCGRWCCHYGGTLRRRGRGKCPTVVLVRQSAEWWWGWLSAEPLGGSLAKGLAASKAPKTLEKLTATPWAPLSVGGSGPRWCKGRCNLRSSHRGSSTSCHSSSPLLLQAAGGRSWSHTACRCGNRCRSAPLGSTCMCHHTGLEPVLVLVWAWRSVQQWEQPTVGWMAKRLAFRSAPRSAL